jgi:hypothetical protein
VDHGPRPVHGGPTWWCRQKTIGERLGRRTDLSVLADGSREGEGRCGGLAMRLTGARGAMDRLGDSGELAAVVGLGGGVIRCGRGGERGGEWCRMLQGGGVLL